MKFGVFVFGNVKDWEAKFNIYGFSENMNMTMIDSMGNILQEGVEQSYNKYYKISNDEKKSYSDRYSKFLDDLKVMKSKFIGDKFYN